MKKLFRIFKLVHSLNPWAMIQVFLYQALTLAQTYVVLYFSGSIVTMIIAKASYDETIRQVFLFLIVSLVVSTLANLFKRLQDVSTTSVQYKLNDALTKKALSMDYQQLSDPENRLRFQRAEEGSNFSGGITTFVTYIINFGFGIIISLAVAGVALVELTQQKATTLGSISNFTDSLWFPMILVVLILIPLFLTILASRKSAKRQFESFETITHANREFGYMFNTILSDNEPGKTIRLYNAQSMIINVIKTSTEFLIDQLNYVNLKNVRNSGLAQGVTILATGCLYLMIGSKALVGAISIGSVLMYAGYIQTLISNLVQGFGRFTFAQNIINYLQYYIDYLELPDSQSGDIHIENKGSFEFKFEDVSFAYPGSDVNVLENVTLTIGDQERIAVVGQNGAGKTTFIKLLCRLYQPTSGRITLNGIDINELDRDEYMRLLSVVFQDFNLYPFEIADNIALGTSMNEERINEALKVTGVYNKIVSLEHGIHTTIKGQLDEGVNLSGGEAQKVAIARAWYKDTPFVILDEPTAALDPISEFDIYKNFDILMSGKTAIYVSHRMSSCKFCDRILVFENGNVIQDGSHQELIKHEDKLYAELFNAQAQYYVN